MVFCNKCGRENKDFSTFCTDCGNKLLTSIKSAHNQENIPLKEMANNEFLCKQCGKQNKENTKFCITCGNRLASSIQTVPQQVNIPIFEITNNEFLCTQCGKQNKESAIFCVVCGNRLRLTIQEPVKHKTAIAIKAQPLNLENEIHQEKQPAELNLSTPKTHTGEKNDPTVVNVPIHENNSEVDGISTLIKKSNWENSHIEEDKPTVINISIRENIHIKEDSQGMFKKPSDENKKVENVIPLKEDQPINNNSYTWEDIPIEQIPAIIESAQNNVYMPVEKEEVEEQEKGDQMLDSISVIGENYPPNTKKKRKKIIFWTLCILVIAGLGAFFLFGNLSEIFTNKEVSKNQQDIQPKELPKESVGNKIQRVNSVTSHVNKVDSAIIIPEEIKVVKPAVSINKPGLRYTDKNVLIETPAAPTLQMAINDLTGQGISKDLVFTKNAKVLSYDISKKTIQRCNVIITFKLENSDVKYTATL